MQNAQRAAGQRQALMRASNASSQEQRLHAEHTGDALPFHSRPRQPPKPLQITGLYLARHSARVEVHRQFRSLLARELARRRRSKSGSAATNAAVGCPLDAAPKRSTSRPAPRQLIR
jgi:hypothetical protein